MTNKHIISTIVLFAGLLTIYACKKMDDTYRKFVVPDGITYVGKADSVRVSPGRDRIKISWLRGTDSKTTTAVIYWNNKQDSVRVPVDVANPKDTVNVWINNLPENNYTFSIYTLDKDGNSSIAVNVLGATYDSLYESTLLTRGVKAITEVEDGAEIQWYPSDTTSFTTEINYQDAANNQHRIYSPKDSGTVMLPGYTGGTPVRYRSLFKPATNSLDTFYTAFDSVAIKANLLQNNNWTILRIVDNDKVTFTQDKPGSFLAFGGNSGHQGIYQSVDVQAGVNYKLDMHVKGSGATDTWFEAYIGKSMPAQGADYSDGGIKMGLNTWSGCGKTAFDAQLSTMYCSGNGNLISFSSTGTVYVVIKSGGASLGTTGITVSNITLRQAD